MAQLVFSAIEQVEEKFGFSDFFKSIPDHRVERKKLHIVAEILFLTLCGVTANCSSWENIELFGKKQLEFLRKFLPYKE